MRIDRSSFSDNDIVEVAHPAINRHTKATGTKRESNAVIMEWPPSPKSGGQSSRPAATIPPQSCPISSRIGGLEPTSWYNNFSLRDGIHARRAMHTWRVGNVRKVATHGLRIEPQ
jgi:hypothetical protein